LPGTCLAKGFIGFENASVFNGFCYNGGRIVLRHPAPFTRRRLAEKMLEHYANKHVRHLCDFAQQGRQHLTIGNEV
jgi:hypothetical protein